MKYESKTKLLLKQTPCIHHSTIIVGSYSHVWPAVQYPLRSSDWVVFLVARKMDLLSLGILTLPLIVDHDLRLASSSRHGVLLVSISGPSDGPILVANEILILHRSELGDVQSNEPIGGRLCELVRREHLAFVGVPVAEHVSAAVHPDSL